MQQKYQLCSNLSKSGICQSKSWRRKETQNNKYKNSDCKKKTTKQRKKSIQKRQSTCFSNETWR